MPTTLIAALLELVPQIIAAAQTMKGSGTLTSAEEAEIDAALDAANAAIQAT